MQLTISNLSFTYDGSYTPVFDGMNAVVDTSWRLGLIARNGRGKTTLLRLMTGQYAYRGRIDCPLTPVYFPFPVEDSSRSTLEVMLAAAPEAQEWELLREMKSLRVDEGVLDRPFDTLSQGERTKALLAALFSREDVYPLIDEPTNHLDAHGRTLVADYLRRKDGFLLVSHDRAFLNRCIDHVLSLNKADVWVMQGDYDAWEERFNRHNAYEQSRNEDLKKDIRRLEESARRTAGWSDQVERGKIGSGVADRGYVGARAADMMKRSLSTLRRREAAIEEKQSLLHNVEKVGELKLTVLEHPKEVLVSVEDAAVVYGERRVCEHISFQVRRGDRVALAGENGCGKSSVIKALCHQGEALAGRVRLSSGLVISCVPQQTDGLQGGMRDFIRRHQLDETLFKAVLRNMDFTRDLFDRPMDQMSQGQKKKILLARSLCTPAHLYLWDEPLNYIDVYSRVQLEGLILRFAPTLMLVEHDAVFLRRVCTRPAIVLGE